MQTTGQPKHQIALTLVKSVLGTIDQHTAPRNPRLKITCTHSC